MFTGDDIQLSADVNIICADTTVTLVNKDWGVGLYILREKKSHSNEILYVNRHLLIFKKICKWSSRKGKNHKDNWIGIWLTIYEDNILNTE